MRLVRILFMSVIISGSVLAGGKITGKVTDASTGKGLPAANITLNVTNAGTTSDREGRYTFNNVAEGMWVLNITFIGYKPFTITLNIRDGETVTADAALTPTSFQSDEIVITATKTERKVNEIPNRVQIITAQNIQYAPVETIDDAMLYTSGLTVSRTASIWSSKATVNFRGLSTEQGRTLILYDGSNINKTDGGSVNWNQINPLTVERIEISKGANSSLYGNNAMGGVINIINKKPSGLFHAIKSTEYGSFNTIGNKLYIASTYENFFVKFHSLYRTSDGYITDPVKERDTNSAKADLKEMQIGGSFGYDFSRNHVIELSTLYYDGTRGTGLRYLLGSKEGTQNTYKNYLHQFRYRGAYHQTQWSVQAFYLKENYLDRNESLRGTSYTRYDVDSKRYDKGMGATVTQLISGANTLTAGLDLKWGRVDAADVYKTSSDQVINQGRMVFTSGYLQDEWNFMDNHVKVIAGMRYDYAKFSKGRFLLINSTSATSFLSNFQDTLENKSWQALSPKVSVQYKSGEQWRVFALYGRGYRPPVLDDMCRTGRFSKGLKLANPELRPETMDNFEAGLDVRPFEACGINTSAFYSIGNDFIYDISTGDSTRINNRWRPIMVKDNISSVEFYGAEIDANLDLHPKFTAFLNYSYIHTEIKNFDIKDSRYDTDLTGKHLTDVPPNQFNLGFTWKYHPYFNLMTVLRYKDAQWRDDLNTQKINYYTTLDFKAWAQIHRYLMLSVSCQNLGNEKFIDAKGLQSPGRTFFVELTAQY